MARMRRLKPAAERRIAELAADINETGKPAIDNERVLAFLDQERQPGGVAAGWRETREPLKDQIILDVIRLSHWHFAETGNPVFAFRALGLE